MLEGIPEIIHEVIVVVRINKERIFFGKNEASTYMLFGQISFRRIMHFKYFFCIIIQVLALFVAKIAVRIPVTDNFHWLFYLDGPMIRGKQHPSPTLCYLLNDIPKR